MKKNHGYLQERHKLFSTKLILIMRLTLFFMLIGIFGATAKSFSQQTKLKLDYKRTTVKQILKDIEDQSKYDFVYSNNDFDVNREVDLKVNDASIQEILDRLLDKTGMGYKIVDHVIILSPNGRDLVRAADQGPKTISGKVTDSSGAPLPGVTVVVKGTTTGTITDSNGSYNLKEVPDHATLVFSFVGMKSQEVPVSGKSTIQVEMLEETIGLDEVVAIGYGTKLKGELTGSFAKVNSDQIESRPVTGTQEALQGIVPGVIITRESGKPGRQDYALKIRGTSSVNGSVPLVLIDGVPGDIDLINPQDIEDLTVLKDAAAAIYGARAADGVILITTKKGKKSDRPQVSYSYNFALKQPGIMKKAATTEHFVKMFNEANSNDGDPQAFSDETLEKIAANDPGEGPGENWGVTSYPMFYRSKDWYGDFFKTSQRQTHNLSISGGGNNSTYLISFGNVNDDGNISAGKNSSDRYNLRVNLQSNLLDHLKFNANVAYDDLEIKEPSQLDDAINNALKVFSYVPLRNPAGNYYGYQGYENPFQEVEMGGNRKTKDSRLSNNFKLDWEPIKGLVWTGQAAFNLEWNDDQAYYATNYEHNWDNSINSLPRNNPNSAYFSDSNTLYKNFSTYINYGKVIQKHSIKLMVGASREKFTRESKYMEGADFSSNEIFTLPLSDPKNLSAGDYWDNNPWALLSYFGRASYSFNGKYYLDGTFRKDGSSKFSPDKRWSDVYPSISAAWKISEEPFFKSVIPDDVFNMLKIRASWGRTGNQDISELGLFDYIQLIDIVGGKYPNQYPIDGSTMSKMALLNGIASPDRTWETIETKNLGFDVALLNSKLTASFDVYRKKNSDMLVNVAYPATLGAPAPTSNAGTLLNKGWELTGNWNSNVGDLKFNIGFVVNYNTNKLTNLQGQDTYDVGLTRARQGYPLNSYFGYKGSVIRTQSELDAYASKYAGKGIVPGTQPSGHKGLGIGDVMFEDLDGDGQITPYGDNSKGYSGDAVFLGSQDPKVTYSMSGGLNYKNFDFAFILQGTGDKYTWRGNGNFGVPLRNYWFQPLDYFYGKTFTQENPDTKYPRLSNDETVKSNNYQFSTVYLENTKYLRVKNITIGYTFKNILLSKFKLQSVRIYLSGQDIFEFAKGTWGKTYDPEESTSDPDKPYYYENNYPMYRTYSFGASVNF